MRMLLGMQRNADANINNKHPAVTETRAEKDVEIAIDDGHERQKILLGETAVEIEIETIGGIDIEIVVATVKEDTDSHPMKQTAIGAHADIGLEMMIQSVTVARWLGVERAQ